MVFTTLWNSRPRRLNPPSAYGSVGCQPITSISKLGRIPPIAPTDRLADMALAFGADSPNRTGLFIEIFTVMLYCMTICTQLGRLATNL